MLIVVAAGCTFPADTFDAYSHDAQLTIDEVTSQAESALLAVDLLTEDRTFRTAALVQLEDAEAAAGDATETFAATFPPDPRSESLRENVLPQLQVSTDLITRIRFAIDRGDVAGASDLSSILRDTTLGLESSLARLP